MKRVKRQSLLEVWSCSRFDHCQQLQNTLDLPLAAIKREKLALLAVDDQAQRKILAQEVRSDRRGNSHAIFFSRMLTLARLHALVQIQENPGVERGIKVALLHHQLTMITARTPVNAPQGVAIHIIAHRRRVGCSLQGTARSASTSRQTSGKH